MVFPLQRDSTLHYKNPMQFIQTPESLPWVQHAFKLSSFSRHEGGGAQQGLDDRFQTIGFGASWCAVSVT